MKRYIKRELIQPAHLIALPVTEWTDQERVAGRCERKQKMLPIDTGEILYMIAITPISQSAPSESDMRASIGLQYAIDPKHRGEPSVELGDYMELNENEHAYLIKKLDAQRWFSVELRETFELIQNWKEAPNIRPFELKSNGRIKAGKV